MTQELHYSRPVATANRLALDAEDIHRFLDKRVLLTGESFILNTENGRQCLLSSLLLLVRICRNVSVSLPQGIEGLSIKCKAEANRISFDAPVNFIEGEPDYYSYDAILSIGTIARPDLPWTVINSDGWLARVSSGKTDLPATTKQTNPIGALAAASLGVAEVFKRLLRVKESRGALVNEITFSLFSYSTKDTKTGPSLPNDMALDLLIVGGGAIGNGIIHLLNSITASGHVWILDKQTFQPENLGTCMLIGPNDMGMEKAIFAEKILSPQYISKGLHEDISNISNQVGTAMPYPKIIINGLDNIDARHEAQHLWPDMIIDGAISDFGCQVSRHPWGDDTACLLCLFRQPAGELAERVASRATGLKEERILRATDNDKIGENDIKTAPPEKQEWLRSHIGQQICSVVQEGMVQQISKSEQEKGFAPSVPFVATLSASMVVGELIKFVMGWKTPLEPRYQLDILRGPSSGQFVPQERRRDCLCYTRRNNIETVRNYRNFQKPSTI